MAQGLLGRLDMIPNLLRVTSGSSQQSLLWVARFGNVEVKKIVQLDNTKLYFTTSVVIKNIASTAITEIFCKYECYYEEMTCVIKELYLLFVWLLQCPHCYLFMSVYMSADARTMNPDQEYRQYHIFDTLNYVQFQPDIVGSPSYVSTVNSNTALTCTAGINNYDFYLAMGAVSKRSKASHLPSDLFNPKQAYTDSKWKSFGGNDVIPTAAYRSRMKNGDDTMNLAFYYPIINPGQVVSFEYVHILHYSEQAEALANLEHVLIAQPTDVTSGGAAVLSVVLKNANVAATSVVFSLFATLTAASSATWHTIATVTNIVKRSHSPRMLQQHWRS